ncbi:MFS transporter [Paratractidigestivibacter sp.]|uniref:MFS transporter n=1 Tax=Paratractidigestivibacter sp. TaxID=2847316 RepID=UPI002AC8E61C|nr:MFS transporter [Paratractidigestivibacter sp.]
MSSTTASKSFWDGPLTSSLAKKDRVTTPEMLFGYLIGPFGGLLASGIFTSQLQNYFTDVLQLDLSFLTGLQLFSTILIVIANLVVGQLIERTHCLAGKARPWVLLSALTFSVSTVFMFFVPFEGVAKMVWIAIAYNLYYAVAYPIYNTANSTLVAVSTRDTEKRGTLASLTNISGFGVMGTGTMIFPMLVSFALKQDQNLWLLAMLVVALLTALTVYLQYRFTRERITEEVLAGVAADDEKGDKSAAPSLGDQLSAVARESQWWIIMGVYLLYQWSGAIKNGSMTYFCKWVLDNTFFGTADAWGASQSMLSLLGALPMAAAILFVIPLCNKFGKQRVCIAGMVVGVVGGIIAYVGGGSIVPVGVGIALKCLGSAPIGYMILAMLADVIDHVEFKSNLRTDGLTMSIYSSIMVAATPICNAIFSGILSAVGYDQAADITLGTMAQTALTQNAISISYILVETIAFALCGALLVSFNVEKNLPEEQAALKERHEKAA